MKFSRPDADIFVPSGQTPGEALSQVSHLCVAAHADDIEIMAYAGIVDCLEHKTKGFGGVVVTDGAGSPRSGVYSKFTDEEITRVRRDEQRRAAEIGGYRIQIQLAHPSSAVKSRAVADDVIKDLAALFSGCSPEVLYLHNPADKHDTHVGVLSRCVEALRSLPLAKRPHRVLGCEVWRDLDWLIESDKIPLDSGRRPELAADLLKAFDSQINGGKRYDLATLGRRLAHATFNTSHATDAVSGLTWAMDLAPLVADDRVSIAEYTQAYVQRLRADVSARIAKVS